jgi:hypothetical protein
MMSYPEQKTTSERHAFLPNRWQRITAVLLITALAALVAIFVFNVALNTVITYGLFGLFIVSHLFMHGGHGHDHSRHAPVQEPIPPAEQENDD